MNIDKLKQVIQEANPEIMELNIGCRVAHKYHSSQSIVVENEQDNLSPFDVQTDDGGFEKDKVISLGRPIRLADVLMAINKISIMQIGVFNDGTFLHKGDDMGWRWNLKDNNLDNQSDETKQFLIDLLVKTAKGN